MVNHIHSVVKICQLFISELSTVIDSTNQILIPGADHDIMKRRHQWNVYRLPCTLPPHQTALGSSRSPYSAILQREPVRRLPTKRSVVFRLRLFIQQSEQETFRKHSGHKIYLVRNFLKLISDAKKKTQETMAYPKRFSQLQQ